MSTRNSSAGDTLHHATASDVVAGDAGDVTRTGSGTEPAAEPAAGRAPTLKEQESSGGTSSEDKDWGHLYDIDEGGSTRLFFHSLVLYLS